MTNASRHDDRKIKLDVLTKYQVRGEREKWSEFKSERYTSRVFCSDMSYHCTENVASYDTLARVYVAM